MKKHIGAVSVVVSDYDEAISFYTESMGFVLKEDTPLGEGKRWVVVAPSETSEAAILLAKGANEEQLKSVGNQTGGRVFLFLHTDDFWRDDEQMSAKGVRFLEKPREEPYGTVAVFEDLYGNKWDLLELVEGTQT